MQPQLNHLALSELRAAVPLAADRRLRPVRSAELHIVSSGIATIIPERGIPCRLHRRVHRERDRQ
jgi:hypothetical protein